MRTEGSLVCLQQHSRAGSAQSRSMGVVHMVWHVSVDKVDNFL